jgi:hypothetical protein
LGGTSLKPQASSDKLQALGTEREASDTIAAGSGSWSMIWNLQS